MKKILEAKAHARITLGLEIIGRTNTGYHQMYIIKQKINLYDFIRVQASHRMKIICDNDQIPKGCDNTVWKAALLIKNKFNIKKNITIEIIKKIPVMAGLAGGSSDAACVIDLLNDFWDLGLAFEEKIKIGREVGMDVPFFFFNGVCVDSETGDKPQNISNTAGLPIVLVYPDFGISTKDAFDEFDKTMYSEKENEIYGLKEAFKEMGIITFDAFWESDRKIDNSKYEEMYKLKDALCDDYNANTIGPVLYNRFEEILFSKYPRLFFIKMRLCDLGCSGALLSGSGSTIFGVAERSSLASNIADKMIAAGYRAQVTETI